MSKIFLVYKKSYHDNIEHLIFFDRISENNEKFRMKPLCGTISFWEPKNDSPSWDKMCPLCLENYRNISIEPHKDRFIIQFQYRNICKFSIIDYRNSELIEINQKKDYEFSQTSKLNDFIDKSFLGKQKNKKSKKRKNNGIINRKSQCVDKIRKINKLEEKDEINISTNTNIPVIQNLDTPSKSYFKNSEDFNKLRIREFEKFKKKRDLERVKGYTNFFKSAEFNIYSQFYPKLEKKSNKDTNGVCYICLEYNCKKGCYLKKDNYPHRRKIINFKY